MLVQICQKSGISEEDSSKDTCISHCQWTLLGKAALDLCLRYPSKDSERLQVDSLMVETKEEVKEVT